MSRKFIPSSRAFAFSADIVLALVLVIGILVFVNDFKPASTDLEERRITDQYVDDLFVSLDHSGYVSKEIDVNGFSAVTLQNTYNKARALLPSSYDFYLQMKSYPVDINACRTSQDFSSCFPDANVSTLSLGTALPTNAPFVHGRRIFLKQQPASQCTSALSGPSNPSPFSVDPFAPFASLQSTDLNIQFDVNASPAGPWTCDQNITVTLSVTSNTGARQPVDMMLVFDRSGSMSYDYLLNTTDALALDIDGDYAYVADSTSGLRDVNGQDPGLLNLVGTYNSPGTARDVDVNSGYAFVADGTSGLRIVNVSTPASPASVAQLVVGGDAYAVATTGNTTYVSTYGTDPVDVSNTGSQNQVLNIGTSATDVSNTGSQNQVLNIGQNSSNQSAGQSFTAGTDSIAAVALYLKKTGSPGTLTVDIRTSISGTVIASTTIAASSVATSYGLVTATFSSPVALTSGSTYYIVATTAANNATNNYQWGAQSGNPYSGGQAYQNTTAQTTWDARFETYYAAFATQSFQPTVAFLTSMDLYVKKTGSPSTALTVSVRSSLTGGLLGSTTIPAASITTSYALTTATFASAVPMTPGSTYYIVLTSGAMSASNNYQWGARSGNTYANGGAYQNNVSQSNWDGRFETYYINGLIKVDTTTKASPIVLGAYPLTDPWRILLSGTTAYVSDGSAGMKIFNVSGNTPTLTGTYDSSGTVYDTVVSGSYAYLSDGSSGLRIVNIATPSSPSLTATYNTPGTAYATRLYGNNAYVADGSSIQVINVATPASPSLVTSYTTPWNYRDLEIKVVSGTPWGFIALDNSLEGLATVNLVTGPKINQAQVAATAFVDFNGWDSNNDQMGLVSYSSSSSSPIDQTLTKTYSLVKSDISGLTANGGTATGDGINSATTHLQSNQTDVSNSGSQNQALTIGQNSSSQSGAQSFQPTMPYVSSVDVYIRRVGSPSNPLTVELRSSISGSALASATILAGSVTTSYVLRTATFSAPVAVTAGSTYYIVATVPTNNATNYYQWGAQSGSPYSGGQAYQNTTSTTWDARFVTHGQYTNPNALKFEILMSDGQTNSGSSSSTAAITAANNDVVIYTIGFGKDADETELSNIASIAGGKYYEAGDQNTLIDVYNLIAQEIQLIATDANVLAGVTSGMTIVDDGNGLLSGGSLLFDINTQVAPPWEVSYTFNIPCTSTLACSSSLLSVPSPGTSFEYVDINGDSQSLSWDEFSTQSFQYRDLNVDILSGNLVGSNNTDLTVQVQSLGSLDTNASVVSFYKGTPTANLLSSVAIPPLCGKQSPGCVNYSYQFTQNVQAEGELYAVVNPAVTIPECTFNDQDLIFCYYTPATQFYTMEYWAWQKG